MKKKLQSGPITVKYVKRTVSEHKNTAWKVAYADFVTAMMAFFLLLWLYSVTTPIQKMGLAEYFQPSSGLKGAEGIGFEGGKHASLKTGTTDTALTDPGLVEGRDRQGPDPGTPDDITADEDDPDADHNASDKNAERHDSNQDAQEFSLVSRDIRQALERDDDLVEFRRDIVLKDLPEGLKIDMIDDSKQPLFAPDSAKLTVAGEKALAAIGGIINRTSNTIAIVGHTNSRDNADPHYTNWELSADRANAVRRFLTENLHQPKRVSKVEGRADREPLVAQEPANARNNRITIILLRGYYLSPPDMPEPPKPAPKKKTSFWPSMIEGELFR